MKFSELSASFWDISNLSSRIAITQKLSDLFLKLSPKEAQVVSYLSLGQLKPPYLKSQFNLAEKTVIKVIASVLSIEPSEVTRIYKETGDLSKIILDYKWNFDDKLTILHVYDELVKLAEISGHGSVEIRAKALETLFFEVGPISASIIVKIVLDNLRLGFSDMTLIDVFSWMICGNKKLRKQIEDAYNLCADIGIIAYDLKSEGITAIEKITPKIGIPIRPAAAERLPGPKEVIEKLGHCAAQPKLDGFRLQVHIKNGKSKFIHFFSRNLLDMSDMFPDLIEAFRYLDVAEVILEGEAIGYEEETGNFVPFQETVKRKRKHGIEEASLELPLKFFAFDIMYLDGKNLMGYNHEHRRNILLKLFNNYKDHRISVIPEVEVSTVKELEDYFLEEYFCRT